MNNITKLVLALLIYSASHASTCTNEQKAKMVMHNIEQSVIDSVCDNEDIERQKISYTKAYIPRERFYISIDISSLGGVNSHTRVTEYSSYKYEETKKVDVTGYSYAASLGYVFGNNNRLEVSASRNQTTELDWIDFEYSTENIDLEYIWMLGSENVKDNSFRVFLLFGAGYSHVVREFYRREMESEDKLNGYSTTLGIGLNYSIDNTLEADIGYSAKGIIWEDGHPDIHDTSTYSMTSSISMVNISLRYKF